MSDQQPLPLPAPPLDLLDGRMLTVHVTDDDIATGRRRSCLRCPIALALRRALSEAGVTVYSAFPVQVFGDYVNVWSATDSPYSAALPLAGRRFILKFDGRGDGVVGPITFALEMRRVFGQLDFEARGEREEAIAREVDG